MLYGDMFQLTWLPYKTGFEEWCKTKRERVALGAGRAWPALGPLTFLAPFSRALSRAAPGPVPRCAPGARALEAGKEAL